VVSATILKFKEKKKAKKKKREENPDTHYDIN
jgi:hypothetical protein